jgi:hypothetical protein
MADIGWATVRCLLAGLLVVLVSAGCTSAREAARGSTTPPSPPAVSAGVGTGPSSPGVAGPGLLVCTQSIGAASAPPPDLRVVLKELALPTGMVLQTSPSGESDAAARLFAKWGLVVRAGVVVDLRVEPGWEGHARIGWGSPASPSVSVHVPGCPPPPGSAQWLHFAGGYYVDQPMCLPLIIRAGGQQVRVLIGVGVACPGQAALSSRALTASWRR